MTQRSKVALGLVAVVIVFVAVTAVGFLPSTQDRELLKNGPPNWVRKVGNWLPSSGMPPVEEIIVSASDIVVLVPEYENGKDSTGTSGSVTIKVGESTDKASRPADLYLEAGPAVTVEVQDEDEAKADSRMGPHKLEPTGEEKRGGAWESRARAVRSRSSRSSLRTAASQVSREFASGSAPLVDTGSAHGVALAAARPP